MKKGMLFQYQTTASGWYYDRKLYPNTAILMALEDLEYENRGAECYYKGLVLSGELIIKAKLVAAFVKKVSP